MQLSRKKIILGTIAVIIVGFGIWFFLFLNTQQRADIVDTTKNLFPFGNLGSSTLNSGGNSQGTIGEDGQAASQNTEDGENPGNEGPRLRRVSQFPTGGFVPLIRIEKEDITETLVDEEGISTEVLRTIDVENHYVRYSSIKDAGIYESEITPSEITEEFLVDNFIPNAEYAYFNNTGERVSFQYWNNENSVPESYLARIEKIKLDIKPCPFDFSPLTLGDDNVKVLGIHQFLNRNPQTRIARSGINAPGNESSLVTESTITAIKNFQSLYQIDIDGQIGPSTKSKMQEVCGLQQQKLAEEEFNKRDKKYKISGFFLPQNIISINMSPDGKEMFYLQKDNLGVIGILRNLVDETKKTIFESPFSEWSSQWSSGTSIEITTKPSYATDGYSYTLDSLTGRYFKSFPERAGLTTLVSPDNSKILISESTKNKVQVSIFERDSKRIRPLSLETFSEKCVWAQNSIDLYCGVPQNLAYGNQYPDYWYQGLEQYSDTLWKIDSDTLQETLVSDIPNEYGQNIDIESIALDAKSDYLYFIDKKIFMELSSC